MTFLKGRTAKAQMSSPAWQKRVAKIGSPREGKVLPSRGQGLIGIQLTDLFSLQPLVPVFRFLLLVHGFVIRLVQLANAGVSLGG